MPTPAASIMPTSQPAYYIWHAPISIQELNHNKNNWSDWSFAMKLMLNQHLIGGYLDKIH
ncbi:hypothetical protein PAXRUDRAFT_19504 [Paxillus rubicundulus Ve08.2h10]|uniref:Uncharacterized protein n=1 Tax=Paxillus rubicundulus Ve08.2h10 TaxID=930991 RepID=A0A0D0CI14_9AGAM|nr:hypothetical protein PAXRUDRAFT_19504 [Paxillus rubicundulus Ve08.2h10]